MSRSTAEVVAEVIRNRKTKKVLCKIDDMAARLSLAEETIARHRAAVVTSIKAAGGAPFHYRRDEDEIAEPWRAYILWDDATDKVAKYLYEDQGVTTKEPMLLAGCNALVLITWLPQFYDPAARQSSSIDPEEQCIRDEEHLAATAAMVQTLLLMLTSYNMGTYWSSGGRLRKPEMFEYLGIPTNQRLLAAVFVEYPEMMQDDSKQRKPGSHRDSRSNKWISEISI